MDIYQIWTTYNPMWSEREIICFSVLMILVMAMVIQGIQKKKWNPIQGVAIGFHTLGSDPMKYL